MKGQREANVVSSGWLMLKPHALGLCSCRELPNVVGAHQIISQHTGDLSSKQTPLAPCTSLPSTHPPSLLFCFFCSAPVTFLSPSFLLHIKHTLPYCTAFHLADSTSTKHHSLLYSLEPGCSLLYNNLFSPITLYETKHLQHSYLPYLVWTVSGFNQQSLITSYSFSIYHSIPIERYTKKLLRGLSVYCD